MRKILLTGLAVLMVLFITACGSEEEDEVLDFHNDMVDTLQPIYEEVGALGEEIMTLSDEEVYEKLEQELVPKAEESEKFFAKYDPETEPTIEYYGLRKAANDDFVTYAYEAKDITKDLIDGKITEDEFLNQVIEATEYMDLFIDKSEEADARWEEISDEYSFEEIKE